MRHTLFALALCFAAVVSAPRAWSQTPDVEALIHEGVELRRVGQDGEALERFQQAHRRAPSSRTLAQMGFAEQALGRWADAQLHLQQSLDLSDDPWARDRRALIEQALRDVGSHLGTLEVLCDAPGAQVTVDDGAPMNLPLAASLRLNAGAHHLTLRAPGRQTVHRDVEVLASQPTRASITLAPEAPTAPTPPAPHDAVVVTAPDPLVDDPPSHAQRTFGWVTAGTGVAALGMGVVSLLVHNSAANHWNSDACLTGGMTRFENCQSDRSLGRTTEALSVAGFVAGGAMLVTGIILVLAAPRASSPRRARLDVEVSAGGFALTLGGAL